MSNIKKIKMSDASDSVLEVNVPEVSEFDGNFVYNFYVINERVSPPKTVDSFGEQLALSKISRYVTLSWKTPPAPPASPSPPEKSIGRMNSMGKVLSEEEFFNPGMMTHIFSDVSAIEQGASDLENYSRMQQHDTESVFKMSQYQLQEVKSNVEDVPTSQFETLSKDFDKLVDFPKSSLGLRVYDSAGQEVRDESGLIRSLTDSVTLNVKLNSAVIPDVFKDSDVKSSKFNFKILKDSYEASKNKKTESEFLTIPAAFTIKSSEQGSDSTGNPYNLVGYMIEKYVASPEGFTKLNTFYVEDPTQTTYVDKDILYGLTYVYAIKTVVSVTVLTYPDDPSGQSKAVASAVYLSSRPISHAIECYEYAQPPEPIDVRFTYDRMRKMFMITWDMPVNPQRDVKQFQVFRRKTIKEPFELIAQYGFDDSEVGKSGTRYRTGERVDANNLDGMLQDDKHLVRFVRDTPTSQPRPTFVHHDKSFMVDDESYTSSEYIYAVCSVDAHGMTSNYSTQHQVRFDAYTNNLVSHVVCDAGSPRQYPNMNLRLDAFKDVIKFSDSSIRQMNIHFTPEFDSIVDNRGVKVNVVMTKKIDPESHYIFQMINLDNQKLQSTRIDVEDTTSKS